MIMPVQFFNEMSPILPDLRREFGTPFYLYHEKGIRQTCQRMKRAYCGIRGFQEYYAVKALPVPRILEIIRDEGFGFDCSSPHEIDRALQAGAFGEGEIMFTSNNTQRHEFVHAMTAHAIINLDDVSHIDKVPGQPFPDLISFRFNPGVRRAGFGQWDPAKAKFGITWDQLVPAYAAARERGATRFGLHTMLVSNVRDYRYMVTTVRMLLSVVAKLERELGIRCEFINKGGSLGIPYKPHQREFDIEAEGAAIKNLLYRFRDDHGWAPKLFMESGRYVTGPHGVLVTSVINRKETYETFIGLDAGMNALVRPAMYNSYHEILVLDDQGFMSRAPKEVASFTGSICEDNDRVGTRRRTSRADEDDFVVVGNCGAHSVAMVGQYNDRYAPKQLLLRADGSVELVARERLPKDVDAVYRFKERVWTT